jgi:hypothetical protein
MYRSYDSSNHGPLARLHQAELHEAAERTRRLALTVRPRRWSLASALEVVRRSLGLVLIRAGQRLHGAAPEIAGVTPVGLPAAR